MNIQMLQYLFMLFKVWICAIHAISYISIAVSAIYMKQTTSWAAEMLIKHEAKQSALLALRPYAECFTSCIA